MSTKPAASSQPEPEFADVPPSRTSVVIGLTLVAVILVLALGVLVHRSLRGDASHRVLHVQANQAWHGMTLKLTGPALSRPLTAPIDPSGGYGVPFFVPPGTYKLRVIDGNRELFSRDVNLTSVPWTQVDLPAVGPASQPATHSR